MVMGTHKNFIIMTDEDIGNPDYYIIIGYAINQFYEPTKSIIFQMEPWVYNINKPWGVHAWKEWAIPNVNKFKHVRRHVNYLNPAQWFFKEPEIINYNRKNKIIAIISNKLNDTGHINRINFIRLIEKYFPDLIDVYGYHNYHNLKSYKGTISDKSIIQDYKYMFSVENNNEYNYATEKIWESFIAETFCFYDGCPNLSDYVDSKSYMAIDSSNPKSLSIVIDAIKNDLWSERLSYIKSAKKLTKERYNILEVINGIIN
jgi:hypothetical protein